MNDNDSPPRAPEEKPHPKFAMPAPRRKGGEGEREDGLAPRVLAVLLGIACIIAGIGLGVSVVLLPVGIVVGLAGVGLLFWGLFAPAFKRS